MFCIYVIYVVLLYEILIGTRVPLLWPFETHRCIPLYKSYPLYNLFCSSDPGLRKYTYIHLVIGHWVWSLIAPNRTTFEISCFSLWNPVLLKHTNTSILWLYHTLCNHLFSHWLAHTKDPRKGQSYHGQCLTPQMRTLRPTGVSLEKGELPVMVRLQFCLGKGWASSRGRWPSCLPRSLGQGGFRQLKQAVSRVLPAVLLSQIGPQTGAHPGLWGLPDSLVDFGTENGPHGNTRQKRSCLRKPFIKYFYWEMQSKFPRNFPSSTNVSINWRPPKLVLVHWTTVDFIATGARQYNRTWWVPRGISGHLGHEPMLR